jgi:hypothetical protein
MAFEKTDVVYCENHTKNTNSVGRMISLRMLKHVVNIGATRLQRIKKTALVMASSISHLKTGMGRCILLKYTHFINLTFVKCFPVFSMVYIYCRNKCAVPKLITFHITLLIARNCLFLFHT